MADTRQFLQVGVPIKPAKTHSKQTKAKESKRQWEVPTLQEWDNDQVVDQPIDQKNNDRCQVLPFIASQE